MKLGSSLPQNPGPHRSPGSENSDIRKLIPSSRGQMLSLANVTVPRNEARTCKDTLWASPYRFWTRFSWRPDLLQAWLKNSMSLQGHGTWGDRMCCGSNWVRTPDKNYVLGSNIDVIDVNGGRFEFKSASQSQKTFCLLLRPFDTNLSSAMIA